MMLADWAECPNCHFAASHRQLVGILQAEGRCPMCNDPVDASSVKRMLDPMARLKQQQEKLSQQGKEGAAAVTKLMAANAMS